MNIRYVTLDPTGNITCLVSCPVPKALRSRVTAALMERCEQVGYLTEPSLPGARARLEMMGGEFCGNAAMAAAAYLCRRDGSERETAVPLEVSGAEGIVRCTARPIGEDVFLGTAEMPRILEIRDTVIGKYPAALVCMEGIAHLIVKDVPVPEEQAGALLKEAAGKTEAAAAGLLLWDSEKMFMRPLVYVKASGTLVWETGCGSGSTAVGAYLALARGDGVTRSEIRQGGGVIVTEAEVRSGRVASVRISGRVRVGSEETTSIGDEKE